MLSLRGHLRRRPVPLWGFPSAQPGGRPCPVSRDCPVWPPSLGLGGLFVARGQGTGLLGSRSGLQGQHSPVCFWDGAGRAGELGAGGATTFSPAPVHVAGGPASEMPVTLSPPLKLPFFFFFLNQKGRGGEERKGSPSPGPRLGVWGDRLTLCFGSRVFLTLSNFTPSPDTRSLSYSICGEWPSRAAEGMGCLAH